MAEFDDTLSSTAKLWHWTPEPPAKASWHFVTVTGPVADSLRARVRIADDGRGARFLIGARRGAHQPRELPTSVFRYSESGGYLLPVKAGFGGTPVSRRGTRSKSKSESERSQVRQAAYSTARAAI